MIKTFQIVSQVRAKNITNALKRVGKAEIKQIHELVPKAPEQLAPAVGFGVEDPEEEVYEDE